MPELPDVEGFRRYFSRFAAGRRIERVEVRSADQLRNATPAVLGRALRGREFARPRRHGKWLIAPAGGPIVLLHFGMTGDLVWRSAEHPHDRLVFWLEDGPLAYRNMRKLGGVWLAREEGGIEAITGPLGPDAAGVNRTDLESLLGGRRGGLKALLMNQRVLAGIGNELSDEILWQACLAPRRDVRSLDRRRLDALHRAMSETIRVSSRHGHIPRLDGWLTSQRGRRDPRCPRCEARMRRETVAGRTAYWCARCQR